jgi:hypothetical protein
MESILRRETELSASTRSSCFLKLNELIKPRSLLSCSNWAHLSEDLLSVFDHPIIVDGLVCQALRVSGLVRLKDNC